MDRRVIGTVLVVAALAGSLLLLRGGSDAGGERAQPTGELRFRGERLPGTLYLSAGQESINADLYRVSGSLDSTQRLTRDGRVSAIGAYDGRLAVSNAYGSGSDRLELANLRGGPALPGRMVDQAGQSPVYGPGGRLLYEVQRYDADGGDAGVKVLVAEADGSHRRVALESRRSDVNAGWGPGGRVAAVYDEKPRIVLDPGGRREQSLRVPLKRVTQFATSVDGRLYAIDAQDRIAFRDRDGRWTVYRTPWRGTLAWAPDGKSVLVSRGDRLGLLDPADGAVREIGRVDNGEVYGAAWVGAGGQ